MNELHILSIYSLPHTYVALGNLTYLIKPQFTHASDGH